MNIQENELILKKREIINNYQVTIQAIQSFISLITWDESRLDVYEDSHYWVGRKMTPNGDGIHSSNVVHVTPDVVLQKDIFGYVVEVKKTICKNDEYWKDIVDQLHKYSRPLVGWWTEDEKIHNQNPILLINAAHSYEFSEYLKQTEAEFDGQFAIVEFLRNDGVNEFIFLRKYEGKLIPQELDEYLVKGSQMPIEKIIGSYGELKFYDVEPLAVEYMMSELWQNIFNNKKSEIGKYNEKYSRWEFDVTIDELTTELQKLYGGKSSNSRDVSFPKISWVKRALDWFVNIDYAKNIENDIYRIYFKKLRNDVLSTFVTKVADYENQASTIKDQPSLFDSSIE